MKFTIIQGMGTVTRMVTRNVHVYSVGFVSALIVFRSAITIQ